MTSSTAMGAPVTPESLSPMPPAHSIFEYLTNKNPDICHQGQGGSITINHDFLSPRILRPWHEFNFDTMEEIFNRELMTECKRHRLMYHIYPPPDPNRDLIEAKEDSTQWILKSWTIPMVNNALEAVKSSLNPVFWTAQSLSELPKPSDAPTRADDTRSTVGSRPIRQVRKHVMLSGKGRKAKSFIPDGGGLSLEYGRLDARSAPTDCPKKSNQGQSGPVNLLLLGILSMKTGTGFRRKSCTEMPLLSGKSTRIV
ncbi:hypothetical protein RRF57_003327 [Xylaria bambusicola]|uniref:Uncharacterized protein n=1 Tax=Xylaria bambusicola TaxID=326684 RepID=A0AAN7UGD3_9PEZI